MKRILIIISTLLIAISASAQESLLNFKYQDGKIIWQKVFDGDLTKEDIQIGLMKNLDCYNILFLEDRGVAKTTDIVVDYTLAGYKPMQLSTTFFNAKRMSAFVTIQTKPGHYRITLENISFLYSDANSIKVFGSSAPIEGTLVKNGQIDKADYITRTAQSIDALFEEVFSFSNTGIEVDSNW